MAHLAKNCLKDNMKEINEKLASIAWAMSNAAKDIESSTNLLRKLTHDFETVKHEIDKFKNEKIHDRH